MGSGSSKQKSKSSGSSPLSGYFSDLEAKCLRALFAQFNSPLLSIDEVELDMCVPLSGMKAYFNTFLPSAMTNALVTYFKPSTTATSNQLSFGMFLERVKNLLTGNWEQKTVLVDCYIRGNQGATVHQFLSDIAKIGLFYYDFYPSKEQLSAATGDDKSSLMLPFNPKFMKNAPKDLAVSDVFVHYLESSFQQLMTSNYSSHEENVSQVTITFNDIKEKLAQNSVVQKLLEIFFSNLFMPSSFLSTPPPSRPGSGSTNIPPAKPTNTRKKPTAPTQSLTAVEKITQRLRRQQMKRPRFESTTKSKPSLLSTSESVFLLDYQLPSEFQSNIYWKKIFCLRDMGVSWTNFMNALMNNPGSTLLVMKDTDGYVFGALAGSNWSIEPKFYGTPDSYLFRLAPKMEVFKPTGINSNYQYFHHGAHTLPNGIGFGGQMDYWGLFLRSDDFKRGVSMANPTSTTFGNTRLSKNENFELAECKFLYSQSLCFVRY